ncbi:4915_t:CDS:2 [Entrophospora sp. SA101]|nr:4915_t:CDS:2 [Entrophospora sp. SA101]
MTMMITILKLFHEEIMQQQPADKDNRESFLSSSSPSSARNPKRRQFQKSLEHFQFASRSVSLLRESLSCREIQLFHQENQQQRLPEITKINELQRKPYKRLPIDKNKFVRPLLLSSASTRTTSNPTSQRHRQQLDNNNNYNEPMERGSL